MKVVELRERGGLDGLVLTERAAPRPGPGEILVRVQAATLNYRDLAIARGSYGDFPLPVVPLSDACGEVEAVFAFDAFRDAYRHLAQAGHVGKIAIAME